uniref:podocalyxin isoform X2 n=1 Tax=Pristiophorus japonicus TaxID=55135 RepID=UPI00398F4093
MRLLLFLSFLAGLWSISIPTTITLTVSSNAMRTVTDVSITAQHTSSTSVIVPSSTATQKEESTVSNSSTVAEGNNSTATITAPTMTTPTLGAMPGVVTNPATTTLTNTMSVTSTGQSNTTTVQREGFTPTASHQNESSASTTQKSTSDVIPETTSPTVVTKTAPTDSAVNSTSVNSSPAITQSTHLVNTTVSALFKTTPTSVTATGAMNDNLQTNKRILLITSTEEISHNTSTEETKKNVTEGTLEKSSSPQGTMENANEETQGTASTNSKTDIQSEVHCVAESSSQKNFLILNKSMDCKEFKRMYGQTLGNLLCSAVAGNENFKGFTHCEIRLSPVKEVQSTLNIDISFKVDENKVNKVLGNMETRLTEYLTEEMRSVVNGCHDNPAMDISERESEMQEKKPNSNANFLENTDSWIVPMDSLTKDELDEEDTHL